MATNFIEIYNMFLNDIKDYVLVDNLIQDELYKILYDYLDESASLHFKKCKKDLSIRNSDLKQFNEDLDNEEKRILSKGMVLSWLEPYVNNEETLSTRLTTKDYRLYSPANQLKTMIELKKSTQKQLNSYINSYLYNNFKGYGK